jgi:hypothetical protein
VSAVRRLYVVCHSQPAQRCYKQNNNKAKPVTHCASYTLFLQVSVLSMFSLVLTVLSGTCLHFYATYKRRTTNNSFYFYNMRYTKPYRRSCCHYLHERVICEDCSDRVKLTLSLLPFPHCRSCFYWRRGAYHLVCCRETRLH